MNLRVFRAIRLVFPAVLILSQSLLAEDWPQWRGPERDGISRENGLLESWPPEGPTQVWQIQNLGSGYGSVSIRDDRIFVLGVKGGDSTLFSLTRAYGKLLWSHPLGNSLDHGRGDGPRSTPTLDQNRVYALAENGELACVDFEGGSTIWQRNILKEFGGQNPNWLLSESPLVDGNQLIVTPGGPDASIVALDKQTGKTIWTSKGLSDPAGYSSCISTDFNDIHMILAFTAKAAVAVRAADGVLMWRYEPVANKTANVATPVIKGDKVFYTSAYRTGGALLQLQPDGGRVKVEEVYFSKEMQNHHGGVVLLDGYIYGFSQSVLSCVKFETGELVWRDRSVGKGALTYADGNLYLLGEDNAVGLAKASPEGYQELGRFKIEDQGWPSWAHPVVSGGRLYIRNQGTLTCYNIRR